MSKKTIISAGLALLLAGGGFGGYTWNQSLQEKKAYAATLDQVHSLKNDVGALYTDESKQELKAKVNLEKIDQLSSRNISVKDDHLKKDDKVVLN